MLFWYRVIIEPVSLWQVLKFNDKWLHRYYYVVIYFLLPSRFREHGDGSAIHFEGNSSGVVAVSHHGCTLHPRWNTASVFRLVISVVIFRCVLASLYEGLSVRRSVRPSVRRSVTLSSKTRPIRPTMRPHDDGIIDYLRSKPSIFSFLKKAWPTNGRTDRRTDGRTDRRTDRPSYRDARTHLKTVSRELFKILME